MADPVLSGSEPKKFAGHRGYPCDPRRASDVSSWEQLPGDAGKNEARVGFDAVKFSPVIRDREGDVKG